MPAIVQKNLAWLWRMLFYSPDQPSAEVSRMLVPTIDVSMDWPQTPAIKNADYNTIAGTVTTNFTVPEGHHWLIDHMTLVGNFVGTDQVSIEIVNGSMRFELQRHNALAIVNLPVVGGHSSQAGIQYRGIPGKIYLPGGWAISVLHSSVLGGFPVLCRMVVRDQLDFSPLRTL